VSRVARAACRPGHAPPSYTHDVPRISAESVQAHSQQVRERIYAAFASLMDERSFDAISMADIAERAGLRRTAIYHHFRDKEAVVVAFATHETDRYLAALEADLAEAADPVAKIRIYIRHQAEAGQQFHTGMGGILYHLLSESAMREIRDHVASVERVLEDILVEGEREGVFTIPDHRAAISLLHACLAPRHLPLESVEQFVLAGLGHPPA
jgi:AcrR family transcriptional regulator